MNDRKSVKQEEPTVMLCTQPTIIDSSFSKSLLFTTSPRVHTIDKITKSLITSNPTLNSLVFHRYILSLILILLMCSVATVQTTSDQNVPKDNNSINPEPCLQYQTECDSREEDKSLPATKELSNKSHPREDDKAYKEAESNDSGVSDKRGKRDHGRHDSKVRMRYKDRIVKSSDEGITIHSVINQPEIVPSQQTSTDKILKTAKRKPQQDKGL